MNWNIQLALFDDIRLLLDKISEYDRFFEYNLLIKYHSFVGYDLFA